MTAIKTAKLSKAEINLLKKRIVVIKGALDPDIAAGIIKHTLRDPGWVEASVGAGTVDRGIRNCSVLTLSNPEFRASSPIRTEIDRVVFESAGKVLNAYAEKWPEVMESVSQDTGYEMLRYKKGGFYHQHIDSFTASPRTLSCSWALNDNYEGGEWGFFDGMYKLKLTAGDAVVFPSNSMFPHEIMKVTKGTRYSIITWFR